MSAQKKKYMLVSADGKFMGHTFKNTGPKAAASKAVARGFENVILYEPGRGMVHQYCGCMKDIPEEERTEFMRKLNISKKADVNMVRKAYKATGVQQHYSLHMDDDDNDKHEGYNEDNSSSDDDQ